MERAAGLEFLAGFLELHTAPDDLDDVGSRDQIVDEILGNRPAIQKLNDSPRRQPGLSSPIVIVCEKAWSLSRRQSAIPRP